jgi:hypothetical protein
MANACTKELDDILFDVQILTYSQDRVVVEKMNKKNVLNAEDLLKVDTFVTTIIDKYLDFTKNMPVGGLRHFMLYIINRCNEVKKFIFNYCLEFNIAYTLLTPKNFNIPPMSMCSRIGNQYLEFEMGSWMRKQSILTRVLTLLRCFIMIKFPNITQNTLIYYSNEVTLTRVEMMEKKTK